ncbi:MAG: DUF2071 domain-containing protein [Flammeovirgaceae bacterium]
MASTFLTAEWRKLLMANYVVSPDLFKPHVPNNTELDFWNERCYVSLVGFLFKNTRLKGIKIPFHSTFEEVNLRFYVKYKDGLNWKRGVVFIKEIVPKPMLSFVANIIYGEHYETLPMKHSWNFKEHYQEIKYEWKKRNNWNHIWAKAEKQENPLKKDTEEEFITEHYWGYTKINHLKTSEYEVSHPSWVTYKIIDYHIEVDFSMVYGENFGFLNHQKPISIFLAEGSEIVVKTGNVIKN